MHNRKSPDRLKKSYPYLLDTGVPDLVYSSKTNARVCFECGGVGCLVCFMAGYIFIDPTRYDQVIKLAWQNAEEEA